MGTLILTSQGFTPKIEKELLTHVKNPDTKSVVIITTPARGKEKNKYVQLTKRQFEGMGFKDIKFLDLEFDQIEDFSNIDILYVFGGNIFRLLKYASETRLKEKVLNFLKKGGIYIGQSAGTVLLGPSIEFCYELEPETNEFGITDFSAFNLIPLFIYPHYTKNSELTLKKLEKKLGIKFERITNEQAIIVRNNGKKYLI